MRLSGAEISKWLLVCAFAFSAACLSRFEAWLFVPVLGIGLLDFSDGWKSAWHNWSTWSRAARFGICASIGAVSWGVYSSYVWGDPFAAARRSFVISKELMPQAGLLYRIAAAPGGLGMTISPLLALLILWGVVAQLRRTSQGARVLLLLAMILLGAHMFNAVDKNLTMARYTLLYSWLFLPFGFLALSDLEKRWPKIQRKTGVAILLAFLFLWQVGVVLGAHFAPDSVASKLGSISPTLPLDPDLRGAITWLRTHIHPYDAVVIDAFHYDGIFIVRDSGVKATQVYDVSFPVEDLQQEEKVVAQFVKEKQPRYLVYAPDGQMDVFWKLNGQDQMYHSKLGVELQLRWEHGRYLIYEIIYPPPEPDAIERLN